MKTEMCIENCTRYNTAEKYENRKCKEMCTELKMYTAMKACLNICCLYNMSRGE